MIAVAVEKGSKAYLSNHSFISLQVNELRHHLFTKKGQMPDSIPLHQMLCYSTYVVQSTKVYLFGAKQQKFHLIYLIHGDGDGKKKGAEFHQDG